MKIAVTSTGESVTATLDPRFGRAKLFLIYETEDGSLSALDNLESRESQQGAGVRAAERLVQEDVSAVLTGHCGPKAFQVLRAAGVLVYNCGATTVAGALAELRAGRLRAALDPDVEAHAGLGRSG